LKKSANGVLAAIRGSTYARGRQGAYPLACDRSERFKRSLVCTSSPLRLLRPYSVKGATGRTGVGGREWTAFLTSLQALMTCKIVG